MNSELVSIIMPVYNDESCLLSSIPSVLAQTYQNWELLVIDDCSKDDSGEVIKRYASQDPRIRPFKTDKPSGSPTFPRNIGIENARGRYIAFLDSDDQWLPTKLEHQVDLIERNADAVMVFSNYLMMDEDGHQYPQPVVAPQYTSYRQLLKGNVMGCLTIMYDSQKVGKRSFPSCGHEDYALWLSMLKQGGKAYNTNTVEAVYRVKAGSVSSNRFRAMGWQWTIYTKMENLGFLPSVYYFVHYAVRAVAKRWNILTTLLRKSGS